MAEKAVVGAPGGPHAYDPDSKPAAYRQADVDAAFSGAGVRADRARSDRLAAAKSKKHKKGKKHKKKKSRKHGRVSASETDSSDSGSSSSVSGLAAMGSDRHHFREAGRERPGSLYMTAYAEARSALGQIGWQVDDRAPVFRRWLDVCFVRQHGRSAISERHLEELGANMVCLDFIAQGMYQEAADVVASRSRELITGITSGDWALARQLRTYRLDDPPLVPVGMLEVAARLQRRDERRARNISRGGKAGRSPAR